MLEREQQRLIKINGFIIIIKLVLFSVSGCSDIGYRCTLAESLQISVIFVIKNNLLFFVSMSLFGILHVKSNSWNWIAMNGFIVFVFG